MEGATLQKETSYYSVHPVDGTLVYQGLHRISVEHKLLNQKVTNYLTLECLTYDLIREAYRSSTLNVDVVHDLLELWFPALAETVESWSHCFDLDLEVEGILSKAGYPDFKKPSDSEDELDKENKEHDGDS